MEEYERILKIIGKEAFQKRDEAGYALMDAEKAAVKDLSDEALRDIVGNLSKEDTAKWYELSQNVYV